VVIDLSADFRLKDVEEYAKWYGHKHAAPKLQKEAVYGLTELARDKVKKANLIANPGCYPTCAILPLYPLLEAKLIETYDIIIDAKSGISGAGRSAKVGNLFTEANETVRPYGIASHRHLPEIEQALREASGFRIQVTFTPQVVPLSRGMLATIYVKGDAAKIKAALVKKYKGSAFVKMVDAAPNMRDTAATNRCLISVHADRIKGRAILVSTIDNLVKGASGQAVQNMNVRFGFDEAAGLQFTPVFP
jgi:N-acetyl-gamma-glutamyl-phosphate reductase